MSIGVIRRSKAHRRRLGEVAAADTWWDGNGTISGCVGAWQAKGAASQAASYVDLSGNGNDLVETIASPSWSTGSGWGFVGGSGNTALDTGFVAADANVSIVIRVDSVSAISGDIFCGAWNSGQNNTLVFETSGANSLIWYNASNFFGTESGIDYTSGVFAISGKAAFKNGVAFLDTASPTGSPASLSVYLGALHFLGSPEFGMVGNVIAASLYTEAKSATEVVTITTAMQAL